MSFLTTFTGSVLPAQIADISAHQMGRKVGAIGDSITAAAFNSSAAAYNWAAGGYLTWLKEISRQSLRIAGTNIYATAGYTTAQMVSAGYHTSAAAAGLDFCIVHGGTNDWGTLTAAQTIANLELIYNTVLASGAIVVAIPILPRTNSMTATGRLRITAVNQWIRKFASTNPRVIVVGTDALFTDGTSATGAHVTNLLTTDNLHPNHRGAYVIAYAIWQAISKFIPITDYRFYNPADVYDATDNTRGNLVTNGMLNGTGGSESGTGVSGDTADSWTLMNNTAIGSVGTLTCVGSKVARTDGETGSWQQIVLNGTPTATFSHQLYQTVGLTNVTAGTDVLELVFEYEIDSGHSNLVTVSGFVYDGVFISRSNTSSYTTAADGSIYNGATIQGVGRTEPFTVDAAASTLQAAILFTTVASVAASATIRIGRVSLRKVI